MTTKRHAPPPTKFGPRPAQPAGLVAPGRPGPAPPATRFGAVKPIVQHHRPGVVQRAEDFFAAFGDMDDDAFGGGPPAAVVTVEGTKAFEQGTGTFTRTQVAGAEDTRRITVKSYDFLISSGHGYRQHATGPATFAGQWGLSVDTVEQAIIKDVLKNIETLTGTALAAKYAIVGITASRNEVTVNGVRLQYTANLQDYFNMAQDRSNTIRITDYIVLSKPETGGRRRRASIG